MAILKKRVKIEVVGGTGEKITIILEGSISRERILRVVDMLQPLEVASDEERSSEPEEMSKFDRVLTLLRRRFPVGWFNSQDVMVAYEDVYDEPIGLSTVSTYLSRLVDRGAVSKSGGLATRRYRLRRVEGNNGKRMAPHGESDEGDYLSGGVL